MDTSKHPLVYVDQLMGSSAFSCYVAAAFLQQKGVQLVLMPDKEAAAYLYNDLERLLGDEHIDFYRKKVVFLPSAYKHPYDTDYADAAGLLSRTEIVSRLHAGAKDLLIVSHASAISEKVVSKSTYSKHTLSLSLGDIISQEALIERLVKLKFERVDFVVQPGEYALRGAIMDVFSYAYDYPYRIEFFDDEIESLRAFAADTQLSIKKLKRIKVLPNLNNSLKVEKRHSFLQLLPRHSQLFVCQPQQLYALWQQGFAEAQSKYEALEDRSAHFPPEHLFMSQEALQQELSALPRVMVDSRGDSSRKQTLAASLAQQPHFNKQFVMLLDHLQAQQAKGWTSVIATASVRQQERLRQILTDLAEGRGEKLPTYAALPIDLHTGFLDADNKLAVYTDHQIFNRYQGFKLRAGFKGKEALTIKELYGLVRGDYVSHIDHGIGRFDGLQKLDNNGSVQEVIRLLYKDDDVLFVNIHSLHKIAKHSAKDAVPPKVNRLGSPAWKNLKNKAKKKIKDIAEDLIKLYAERRSKQGVQYMPDTYLQTELEANFMYEDTPDQEKATKAIKADMEKPYPMDRLICGDVGFGKTEIAIRAAFKAATDSKQVAVLVPTTILAFQHYKTFSERLADFPVRVDYISRFRSRKEVKQILEDLKQGKIDILIGTHKIVSQTQHFKDLGLLIIDEEQKFGVSIKEKLKQFKVNLDTLTLSATPIPRTLQFSLMGARDLSIINTPPPNRQAVLTQLTTFNPDTIAEAITYELNRGGQVFFVHNRVQNIEGVARQLRHFVPHVNVAIAHGQMKGEELERTMLDFMEGDYDVLLATKIIESGLDIPNVNTIIINEANHYGLSELHQMRGRVGRSNKKAFCYLLAPPVGMQTEEARKRLRAIEEFSSLGSGFNIAMRDLDIRGAGNILGAEQSGFITDIGYELYQKILDSALQELKEAQLTAADDGMLPTDFVSETQVDTDVSALFPTYYIENSTERLSLYKELSKISSEKELQGFENQLTDRFGPQPQEVLNLWELMRIKWLAKDLGFEKISIKSQRMFAYFIEQQDSKFFSTAFFSQMIAVFQSMENMQMREKNKRLSVVFRKVNNLSVAKKLLLGLRDTLKKD